jgi:hypothetical protein
MFLEWLILQAEIQRRAKTGWRIEINFIKLAEKLQMTSMIRKRKWAKIREQLLEQPPSRKLRGLVTKQNWRGSRGGALSNFDFYTYVPV